jgi:hypothetical protein
VIRPPLPQTSTHNGKLTGSLRTTPAGHTTITKPTHDLRPVDVTANLTLRKRVLSQPQKPRPNPHSGFLTLWTGRAPHLSQVRLRSADNRPTTHQGLPPPGTFPVRTRATRPPPSPTPEQKSPRSAHRSTHATCSRYARAYESPEAPRWSEIRRRAMEPGQDLRVQRQHQSYGRSHHHPRKCSRCCCDNSASRLVRGDPESRANTVALEISSPRRRRSRCGYAQSSAAGTCSLWFMRLHPPVVVDDPWAEVC